MLNLFKNKKIKSLCKSDVTTFYIMLHKLSPVSTTYCVITKNFKDTLKTIHKKYDKTHTILVNEPKKSIVIVKGDFLKKYVVVSTLEEIAQSEFKFGKYL